MNLCVEQKLQDILSSSLQDTTIRFAGIRIWEDEAAPSDDICTVHTVLEARRPAALLLHADRAFLVRLAQAIMHQSVLSTRDVEDVATEYFNIVCGRVVAGLFEADHVSACFQSPCFKPGRYLPQTDSTCRCILSYAGGDHERMQLIYLGLCANGHGANA